MEKMENIQIRTENEKLFKEAAKKILESLSILGTIDQNLHDHFPSLQVKFERREIQIYSEQLTKIAQYINNGMAT